MTSAISVSCSLPRLSLSVPRSTSPFSQYPDSSSSSDNTNSLLWVDFRNRLCQDNGLTSFHCIEADSDSEKEELDYLVGTYASIDVSLEVLGSSCVLNGLGCVLNDDIWGLLCLVCDLGAVVCGLLDSLLGLC